MLDKIYSGQVEKQEDPISLSDKLPVIFVKYSMPKSQHPETAWKCKVCAENLQDAIHTITNLLKKDIKIEEIDESSTVLDAVSFKMSEKIIAIHKAKIEQSKQTMKDKVRKTK